MKTIRDRIALLARRGAGPGLPAGLALGALVLLSACDVEHGHHYRPDYYAPAPPQGLWASAGDGEAELDWLANTEEDLAGYRIYRSREPDGYFPLVATTGPWATAFVDREVENGVTYYYAVSAIDWSGNEGDLSADVVHATPRPDGFGRALNNAAREPEGAGYDFSERRRLDYRDPDADIYYWATPEEGPWMIAQERSVDSYTDIQDAGYVPLDQIRRAPTDGWAPAGEAPLIAGHSYIVWTWDNHYAKFRVVSVNPDEVVLDWAYQLEPGNRELSLDPAVRSHVAGGGNRIHQYGMERRNPS